MNYEENKIAEEILRERCKEGTHGSFHRKDLEDMFPELIEESKNEKIRKSLLLYLHGLGEFEYPDKKTYNDWLSWLEKQKPIEWSEEDKKHRSAAICACSYMIENFESSTNIYEEAIDWLKSLNPQFHWKPSDKQMQALLRTLARIIGSGTYEQDILQTLYNDLKKLREE